MDRQRSATTLIGIAVVALALVSAGCGGGNGDSDGVASLSGNSEQAAGNDKQTNIDPEEAKLKFAKCMREHGVDVPDPGADGSFRGNPGGSDPSSKKFRDAEKACQKYLDQAMPKKLSGEDQAVMQDAALRYAKCMREHGVDMPDPDTSGGRIKMQLPKTGPGNRRFESAQRACQPILDEAAKKAGLEPGKLERRGPSSGS
jgi:hypothetical protein